MAVQTPQPADAAYSAVASVLTGGLALCLDRLAPPDAGDVVAAADLLDRERLEEALGRFARKYPDANRRAVVSMWASWYLATLIPPAMAACLKLGRLPSVGLADIGFILAPEGHVGAVRFARLKEQAPPDDPAERLCPLVMEHLTAFASVMKQNGLSSRLVWCSAASYVEWTTSVLPATEAVAERLLHSPNLPRGLVNPLFDRVRTVHENGIAAARRRVCCLRYLLPDMPGCGASCPLPEGRGTTH